MPTRCRSCSADFPRPDAPLSRCDFPRHSDFPQRSWLCLLMLCGLGLLCISPAISQAAESVQVGVFAVDASPPVGSVLAYDPVKGTQDPLSCRGLVLLGAGKPIVLCAVDWIGISNAGHTIFREKLAQAAGTTPDRVVVHALHQHDAPRCDFSVEQLLQQEQLPTGQIDSTFCRLVIERASQAVQVATREARPVNRLGIGAGIVEKVASNRRLLGPDGKVAHVRYTATKNQFLRDQPEGTIDPELKLVAFYEDETPIAVLTYYATHPQSYYRTGLSSTDFPGLARNARQAATGTPHIHFNGAGGNIGAGKYNDGSHENRQILADRVAAGMQQAWDNQQFSPLTAANIAWRTVPAVLPPAPHLQEETLLNALRAPESTALQRHSAALKLTWLRRCQQADPIDIACLQLGDCCILHLPGELFVEYQLQAQQLRPDLFVCLAAYGDYAPGYIGTEIAYEQGGYETSERATNVAPGVEAVLMQAIKKLLDVEK